MTILSILITIINLVGLSVFAIAGCQKAEHTAGGWLQRASIPLLFSFMGGFLRDCCLLLTVSRQAIPTVFSAYSSWAAVAGGILWYCWQKARDHRSRVDRPWHKLASMLAEYAGSGSFLASGAIRAYNFGVRNPLYLAALSGISTTGGSITVTLLFSRNKRKDFAANLFYLMLMFITALIFAGHLGRLHGSEDQATLLTALACGAVGVFRAYANAALAPHHIHVKRRDMSVEMELGCIYSPGSVFQAIRDLTKRLPHRQPRNSLPKFHSRTYAV